jgi:hypothetical protein
MNLQLRLSPVAVTAALSAVIIALVVIDYALQAIEWDRVGSLQQGYAWVDYPGAFEKPENGPSRTFELVRQRFDFDRDNPTQTIPTWYSSFQFSLAGLLLLAIAFRTKELRLGSRVPWIVLGLLLFFLSIDDTVTVHELLGGEGTIGDQLNDALGLGFVSFDWVVPAVLALVFLLPFFVPFGLRLPLGTLGIFALAATILMVSQVGIETYTGHWLETHSIDTLAYHRQSLAEDTLKLVSQTVLIFGLLAYYRDNLSGASSRHRTLRDLLPFGSKGEPRPAPRGVSGAPAAEREAGAAGDQA